MTYHNRVRDRSKEADRITADSIISMSFGIQPGIVKQNKEKFSTDTDCSSPYSSIRGIFRNGRCSENSQISQEYDRFLATLSEKDRQNARPSLRRPALYGIGNRKSYLSDSNLHKTSDENSAYDRTASDAAKLKRNPSDSVREYKSGSSITGKNSGVNSTSNNKSLRTGDLKYTKENLRASHSVLDSGRGFQAAMNHHSLHPNVYSPQQLSSESASYFRPRTDALSSDLISPMGMEYNGNSQQSKRTNVPDPTENSQYFSCNPVNQRDKTKKRFPVTYTKHLPFSYLNADTAPRLFGLRESIYENIKPSEKSTLPSSKPFSYVEVMHNNDQGYMLKNEVQPAISKTPVHTYKEENRVASNKLAQSTGMNSYSSSFYPNAYEKNNKGFYSSPQNNNYAKERNQNIQNIVNYNREFAYSPNKFNKYNENKNSDSERKIKSLQRERKDATRKSFQRSNSVDSRRGKGSNGDKKEKYDNFFNNEPYNLERNSHMNNWVQQSPNNTSYNYHQRISSSYSPKSSNLIYFGSKQQRDMNDLTDHKISQHFGTVTLPRHKPVEICSFNRITYDGPVAYDERRSTSLTSYRPWLSEMKKSASLPDKSSANDGEKETDRTSVSPTRDRKVDDELENTHATEIKNSISKLSVPENNTSKPHSIVRKSSNKTHKSAKNNIQQTKSDQINMEHLDNSQLSINNTEVQTSPIAPRINRPSHNNVPTRNAVPSTELKFRDDSNYIRPSNKHGTFNKSRQNNSLQGVDQHNGSSIDNNINTTRNAIPPTPHLPGFNQKPLEGKSNLTSKTASTNDSSHQVPAVLSFAQTRFSPAYPTTLNHAVTPSDNSFGCSTTREAKMEKTTAQLLLKPPTDCRPKSTDKTNRNSNPLQANEVVSSNDFLVQPVSSRTGTGDSYFDRTNSSRHSCNTIKTRPEYSQLAQKLEEQFKLGTNFTRNGSYGSLPRQTKPKPETPNEEKIPEPEKKPEQVPQEEKVERAPVLKASDFRALMSSTSETCGMQPVKQKLMMELTQKLALRTTPVKEGTPHQDEQSSLNVKANQAVNVNLTQSKNNVNTLEQTTKKLNCDSTPPIPHTPSSAHSQAAQGERSEYKSPASGAAQKYVSSADEASDTCSTFSSVALSRRKHRKQYAKPRWPIIVSPSLANRPPVKEMVARLGERLVDDPPKHFPRLTQKELDEICGQQSKCSRDASPSVGRPVGTPVASQLY